MTDTSLYFAYGSNMSVAQMEARCPGSQVFLPGSLPGYRLAFRGGKSHWGSGGTATVVADQGAVAHGVLFRLTPAHVEALNRFEAFPKIYGQIEIEVDGQDGARHAAFTYQKNGDAPPNPPPIKYLVQIWRAYRKFGLNEAVLLAAAEESLNGAAATDT